MKENKILSAKEFKKQLLKERGIVSEYELMSEFAKLHVQQALESAAEKANIKQYYYDKCDDNALYQKYKNVGLQRTDEDGIPYGVYVTKIDENSILSAYPEELIIKLL